ncbi:MAG: hypothetical protein CR997_04805 [Acidobacteria bacterium]|nr:MAG: hypothetical protein CR997_04805 [Acidobacteriota bacterium]
MKLFLSVLFAMAGLLCRAQTGVTGQAMVHLEAGGTLCNGAAQLVEVRADVTGLSGGSGEPAGLNGAEVHLTLASGAQTWYARALSGTVSASWPFKVVGTNASQVVVSGNLILAGWAAGDTPNQDYIVGKLVFSGASSSTSGEVSLQNTGTLASKWWNDGTLNGDGPELMAFQTGSSLNITIPVWPGLDLHTACSLWLSSDAAYNFNGSTAVIDVMDLVELTNCMPN